MSGMDAAYLRSTVGVVLAQGCAAVVEAQPTDPVDYLSQWLHNYVKSEGLQVRTCGWLL